MVMLVAFARMADALIMMPGIFTSLAICSDCQGETKFTSVLLKQIINHKVNKIDWPP